MLNVRVVVDFDTCESHGLCVEEAPEVFELRDAALILLNETPDEELLPKLVRAEQACPTQSIFIISD